eukprot:1157053-Pelagomonas_calceolata.AAC.4
MARGVLRSAEEICSSVVFTFSRSSAGRCSFLVALLNSFTDWLPFISQNLEPSAASHSQGHKIML